MAETDTASVITPSVSTAVTYTIAPVSETSSGAQAFSSLTGYWISDPVVLSGNPVTGSVVRWQASPVAGSTITVETSINNGASWDTATSNAPVPRLQSGDTITRSVLARITFALTGASSSGYPSTSLYPSTTLYPSVATPRVSSFELFVSTDASVDELVPLAHGVIDKVETSTTAGSTGSSSSSSGVSAGPGVTGRGGGRIGGGTSIKVHATDPSRAIKRNQWQQPFTVPGGMNYADAAKSMVLNRLPTQTDFALSSTTNVTPLLVYGLDQGGDPWQDIQELATAIGYEAFFDPSGTFVFRPVPDPRYKEPVWTFGPDSNPTVVHAKRELSDEDTFNYVVVIGQGTSATNPVSGFAYDNDPSSPTYILGQYGQVTTRLTFPLLQTTDQCTAAAQAALFNSLGAADTVTIVTVPMPALEPGDVVTVDVPDTKTSGTYVINQMTTSLSPAEAQELVCFRQSTNK